RITARPGETPVLRVSSSTSRRHWARMDLAIATPSMILAVMWSGRPAAEWASRGLLQGQPQLADRLLAHQEFLDLAGHGHRERVDEFDVAWDLVVRDLALAEGADFLGRRGLAGAELDPGAEFLAVARVGDADHLDVLDLRVTVEEFLDLARVHVL